MSEELKIQQDLFKNISYLETYERQERNFWFMIFSLSVVWVITTYLKIYFKYKYMIEQIKLAKQLGSAYDGPSGMYIGLVLEHPIFATEFNKEIYTAIFISYYSIFFKKDMGVGIVKGSPGGSADDYLYQMWNYSRIMGQSKNAFDIVCYVFPQEKEICEKRNCKPSAPFNNFTEYTNAIVGKATSLSVLTHFAGYGSGIGLVAGIGLGVFEASINKQNHDNNQNC